ncbi:MAG: Npun_F0813 family protein [Prochlorothrix sp.]
MFILRRQDVEVSKLQHPTTPEQTIFVLRYNGQVFQLLTTFEPERHADALAFWRDINDNHNRPCILLEEPKRYSVWGQMASDA